MATLKKAEIVRAIHEGVAKAHDQFERLSGGSWMADRGIRGLEGLVVSNIFRSISRSMPANEMPILEFPLGYIGAWTGAKGKGRPKMRVRPTMRVDLAILNRSGKPIHVVEVKQKWTKQTGFADVEKIRDILTSYGPLRRGTLKSVFLSVYWQGTNHPSLATRLVKVEEQVKALLQPAADKIGTRFHWKPSGPIERKWYDRDWEYGSHIIELYRKYRKTG